MATQAEVKNFIAANFNFEELEGDILKFTFEGAEGFAGRSQLVFAYIGPVHLETYSPFAAEDAITATQALNANDSVFGVDIAFGKYCLKQATPVENMDTNELENALLGLAGSAGEIGRKLGLGDEL